MERTTLRLVVTQSAVEDVDRLRIGGPLVPAVSLAKGSEPYVHAGEAVAQACATLDDSPSISRNNQRARLAKRMIVHI
jgi:hypothetical protein